MADVGRSVGRGGRAGVRLVGRGGAAAGRRFRSFADADGAADTGLARLTELHAVNVAADAALTVSLAGTVFALPTDEARGRVALFLVLTMAPFVLLAPLIGPLLDRFRHGRRWALGTTLAIRAFLAWVLASAVVDDSPWLFPAALGLPGRQPVLRRRPRRGGAAAAARRHHAWSPRTPASPSPGWSGWWSAAASPGACRGSARTGRCGWRSSSTSRPRCSPSGCRPGSTPRPASSTSTAHRPARAPLALPSAGRGARRLRALPRSVRYVLWLTTGARLLSGFLTLFLAFLMREHPLPGWSGPGGARHRRGGRRRRQRPRLGDRQPTAQPRARSGSRPCVAVVAVLAALLTAVFYSLPTLVLLGLATGLFGQLAKLSLDALIQRDVDDHVRARVFSWSETILQAFWVVGGAIGITLPLLPVLGFAIVTAVVVLACLVALRSRRVH